jgi:RsiW-degrading membrane proteinase PrsW (M82 family)
MVVQLFNGSIVAMAAAFVIEVFFLVTLIVLLMVVMAFTPDGMAALNEVVANIEDPLWLENPENILSLLSFPPISITLIIVFIVIAPLAEEFLKPLGVALMSYRRPSRAQAFVWGIAGGAGFALTENIFNSLWGLDTWSVVMLVRVGATLMHCLAGGIVALGIHQMLVQRRPLRFFGAYGLSVIIHATWNIMAVSIVGISMFVVGQGDNTALAAVAGIAILFLGGFLLLLLVAIAVGVVMLTYRLRPQATPVDAEAAT